MRFTRVLIGIDQSPLGARALEAGVALAEACGAELGLVYVLDPRLFAGAQGGAPPGEVRSEFERAGRELLATAATRAREGPAPWQFVAWGAPADEIVGAARAWRADLIVLGTHGRSGVSRLLMGSTAEGVLRRASCPVLVVPVRTEEPPEEPPEAAGAARPARRSHP